MKIRLDPADNLFSQYIRLRDGHCVRCGKWQGENGFKHLQCSHYFGRGRESTRFDPENCDALCFYCHRYWGSDNREAYREFKIRQLGEEGFEKLRIRSEMYCKKDRKLSYFAAKVLLKTLDK